MRGRSASRCSCRPSALASYSASTSRTSALRSVASSLARGQSAHSRQTRRPCFHRRHLVDDGLRGARQNRRPPLPAGRPACARCVRPTADRGERVFDLVRQPARHLAPRGVALGVDQLGDVVEYQHIAALDARRQAGAAQQQRLAATVPRIAICSCHSPSCSPKRAATSFPKACNASPG